MNKTTKILMTSLIGIGLNAFTLSCSSSDNRDNVIGENYSISPQNVTLNYDKTQQLSVRNGNTPVADFTWKSSDEKYGTINKEGLLTAKKVGSFEVTATKNGKILKSNVTIVPYQTLFKEPGVDSFGKTMDEIKRQETRQLTLETPTGLGYKGENSNIESIIYIFDKDGKMQSVGVYFHSSTNSTDTVNKVTTFYKERYDVIGTTPDAIIFKHLNQPIKMEMSVDPKLGLNVIYEKK
ncbi:Ig-like domain-containing protein [Elizabethkingia ursingii]|uniref:Ig-like domain-containing protein n=1 Tax=Elizabethkingia ursingii TaxID=1756150 RepID=UPI0007519C9B|nr:Ig-like domain-containing protein [Elizabethkingia ursingii]KUY27279.1 hypothetical protein ATB96_19805 [Elizabethkingia ursingii]